MCFFIIVVSADNFRPYLTSFQGNAFTDYINAVFVDVSFVRMNERNRGCFIWTHSGGLGIEFEDAYNNDSFWPLCFIIPKRMRSAPHFFFEQFPLSSNKYFVISKPNLNFHIFVRLIAGLHKTTWIHRYGMAVEAYRWWILVIGLRPRMFRCCRSLSTATKFGEYFIYKQMQTHITFRFWAHPIETMALPGPQAGLHALWIWYQEVYDHHHCQHQRQRRSATRGRLVIVISLPFYPSQRPSVMDASCCMR